MELTPQRAQCWSVLEAFGGYDAAGVVPAINKAYGDNGRKGWLLPFGGAVVLQSGIIEVMRITPKKLHLFDLQVLSTRYFTVAQDWEVPIPGFLVIASRTQATSVSDLNDAAVVELAKLLRTVRRGMREILRIEHVYLFQNEDSAHGFHVWVFPRHDWMEPFGRKIQSVRPIMDYAASKMVTTEVFEKVTDAAEKMRSYLSEQQCIGSKGGNKTSIEEGSAVCQIPFEFLQ